MLTLVLPQQGFPLAYHVHVTETEVSGCFSVQRTRTRKCVKDISTRMLGLAPQLTVTIWHGIHPIESQCKVVMFFACILICMHTRL